MRVGAVRKYYRQSAKNGYVEINCVNIRDFTLDKHNRVDDAPYGGGMGMLMVRSPYMTAIRAFTVTAKKNRTLYICRRRAKL